MTNKALRGIPKSNSETHNQSYLLEKPEGIAILSTQSKFSGIVGDFFEEVQPYKLQDSSQGVSATF